VAQTLTLRAEAARLLHQPDEAISFHRQALDEWQAADDLAAATDTLHAMEAVREQWTISVENRDAIEEAGQRLTRRHYRVRYFHPLLVAFSRVALVGLVVLFFFTVRLALRSEYGTQVDAVAVLAQPAQPELPADEGPIMAPQDEVRAPELPAIDQQFVPSPPVRAAGLVVAASFVGYLLFYALVGWLVIATTPLAEIEPGEVRAVLIGPEGIRLLTPAGSGDPLPWNDVSVLLRSDRIVVRRPLQMLSFFALFGGATPISISGRTRHYQALQQLARARAEKGTDNKVHIYNLGFDLLHSKSGWLFLVSLVYVLAFFLLAIVKPDLVTRNYDPIPYNAVDLYGLAYLGLALPLAWWFAVQPLRAQWLVSVRTPIVWLVGAAGLGLALISLLQTYRWHLPLGRPDIVTAVLAILLVGVAASHILRARIPSVSGDDKAHAYPRPVRAAVALVASVTLLAMLFAIGWEMSNFHYVAVGNSHLRAAEDYRRNGFQARAEEAYSQALEAYDRALWIRPEAYVHNSQGAVLTRLGRYSDAIYAYNRAQVLDPDEPAYVINQVLVYTSQASAPGVQRIDITLHGLAIHYLTPMIQKLAAEPGRYREQLPTARLLRAGAYYDRGQIYLDQSKEEQAAGDETAAAESHAAAMADFQRALDDYDRVARDGNASTRYRAAGYSGRGWARLKLREGVEAGDVARQQDYLQLAVGDFEQALRRSSREISAMIGLGWAHFYYSQTYPACTRGEGDPAEAVSYQDHLLAARDAYNLVVDQEKAAIHYRVRAQFEYLLRYCDGVSLREQYELTRANYDEALALYEKRATTQDELPASWYNIRGNLSYVVAGIYTDTQKVRETRDRAIADYRRAAQIQPQDLGWWYDLAWVAYEWRNSGYWDASVEGFLGIVDRGPNQYETAAYGRLGWLAYLYQQDYVNSLQYSARALELDRDQSAVHFNEGLVYVVLGEVEAAAQSYLNGIEAADRVGQGRATRYNNAIYDLNTIQADPEGAAGRFAALLEAAKQQQACTLVGEAAPGLLVRAQPHPFPLAEPPVDLLWASDAFFPAARDAGGHWLYGVVKGQEVSGWIPASPAALSCSLDLSVLPVAEPGHLQP
jgi:tetratricopeptide (TPR) repeat protein